MLAWVFAVFFPVNSTCCQKLLFKTKNKNNTKITDGFCRMSLSY